MSISTVIKKLSIVTAGAAVVATALATIPAQATTLFTNRAAFEAATTNLMNIDFEGLVTPDSFDALQLDANGPTLSGVTFSDTQNFTFVIDRPSGDDFDFNGTGGLVVTGATGNLITATLPSGITSVGIDIFSYNTGVLEIITISTGDSFTVTTPSDRTSSKFVGFTSTTPISSISFTANDGQALDNLTFGQASSVSPPPTSVPEPASMLGILVFSALGASSYLKRKQLQKV